MTHFTKLWQAPGSSGFSATGGNGANLNIGGDRVKRKTKSVYNLNDCIV